VYTDLFHQHSQHVQALADHVRSSPEIFPETESKDCKVVPGFDHWSSLGFQMPTGSPLNANHYATVLREPLRYSQCMQNILRKHMKEQPDQELVFVDMGMGPGQLYKFIMATLEHTPEWKRGQVRATASIDPVEAGDAKTKLGWAESQLKANLKRANLFAQSRLPGQGIPVPCQHLSRPWLTNNHRLNQSAPTTEICTHRCKTTVAV
jgi:hypothetical protein